METGQTIAGKYRLNRLLGTGGMASVWSATNVFTEREFAIKFMLPQVARTPEAARRFLLEAKISARVNHPNIIEIIDVGQAEDASLFLVMELLTGSSLDVAIRRKEPIMTAHEFMGIMKDVAVALAAAHRSGVIHRDLKPTNIFLHFDRDGRPVPKLLDFGVSKILEEEANTSLTVVGTVLGSPLYMSPEQAMGAAGIDGRTDVFAFGGILFESLTGHRAFDAPNFNALIVTIATKQPKNIDEVGPELPAVLRALVRECLVTEKDKRIASFEEVADRIDKMLPELLEAKFPLPKPHGERPSDPDATAALPARKSGHTPVTVSAPTAPGTAGPVSGPRSGGTPANLAVRARDLATAWLGSGESFMKTLSPRTLLVAAGGTGAVVLLLIVLGLAAAFSGGGDEPKSTAAIQGSGIAAATGTATAPATVASAQPSSPPFVPSADDSGVPVISVDSLPVAGRGAPAKGNGRLSVIASPGWCSVSVDGVQRGVTPVSTFELPAGGHRLDCVSPSGKTRTASINVAEGTATHYRFTLEE
jgi:eukaryotic-like serine/threonine-protein kinase